MIGRVSAKLGDPDLVHPIQEVTHLAVLLQALEQTAPVLGQLDQQLSRALLVEPIVIVPAVEQTAIKQSRSIDRH